MKFELISLDIFQTLVDVSPNIEHSWRVYLKDNYSEKTAKLGSDLAYKMILAYFAEGHDEFRTVKSVVTECLFKVFDKLNIDCDPQEVDQATLRFYSQAIPFGDAISFINFIEDKYTFIISSDTDNDMISEFEFLKKSDKLFTSEDLGCYKRSEGNRFFNTILSHYNIDPCKILHIGDSSTDVIGPQSAGMKTCWINRNGATWQHNVQPDYIFNDLEEVVSIL